MSLPIFDIPKKKRKKYEAPYYCVVLALFRTRPAPPAPPPRKENSWNRCCQRRILKDRFCVAFAHTTTIRGPPGLSTKGVAQRAALVIILR